MVTLYKDISADEQFEKYFFEEGIKQVEQKSLSDLQINLQFHTYLPRVEKESDFRNSIIGFQRE